MPPTPDALVCLASQSPRRQALLTQIGVPHVVQPADIDESVRAGEDAQSYVTRMACAKALTVRARDGRLPVLAADTTVVVEGALCGKPRDEAQAVSMLQRLAGRSHQVLTAVALAQAEVRCRLSVSEVRLRPLSVAECIAYWRTGEPADKAGGYAVQGLGAVFIERLTGSYSGVMGLPLFETAQLLAAAGIGYWRGSAPEPA
jgi:septum formation protein